MDVLRVRSIPFMARRTYFQELRHLLAWSVLVGLVEGQFAGIVVAKTFHGGNLLITIATTTPTAAYLFSLTWGMLCVGRPKMRLFMLLGTGVALLAGTVGVAPPTPAGAVWFIVQMAAAQALQAGVVTVRSALWRSNYPRAYRGLITGRLEALRFVIALVTVLGAAHLCDRDPLSYRLVYPVAGTLGVIGVALLSPMRVRGERRELRRRAKTDSIEDVYETHMEPFSLTALLSPGHVFRRMIAVLRKDPRFTRYCVAQSFTGVANLMTVPVVVAVVAQDLDLGDAWGFWISTALIQALPNLCRVGSIGRSARYFDRVGVLKLRVVNVSCWVGSLTFGLAATILALGGEGMGATNLIMAVALFALRGFLAGLAFGGGAIAWNIGHLDFVKSAEAEVYMGIHVFLTGVRGLIAPAVGMWLFAVTGWFVWVVAIGSALCSLVMYSRLASEEGT